MYIASEWTTREYPLRIGLWFVVANALVTLAFVFAAPHLASLVPDGRWSAFGWLFILSLLHILAFVLVNIPTIQSLMRDLRPGSTDTR
ncbi:MAG TPA: hypothetical protein PK765_04270 [bacterium]|mgnify:CR=1 FL=1|nr:hypothetical protein [bacterium]